MSAGLALDANNDIFFDGGSSVRSRDGAYTAQQVLTYLQTMQGEHLTDPNYGLPYFSNVFISQKDIPVINQIMIDGILSIAEVESVNSFDSTYDPETRNLLTNFTFTTIYGTVELADFTLTVGGN